MASDRRDSQPTGSRFVGEIDHDEIKHIEVNPLLLTNTQRVSLTFHFSLFNRWLEKELLERFTRQNGEKIS